MWKKVLLSIFILLMLLAISAYYYLPKLASNKIYQALDKADSVSFSNLALDLSNGDVFINQFYLSDSTGSIAKIPLYANVKTFRIRGVGFWKLIGRRVLEIDSLVIGKGELKILLTRKDSTESQISTSKPAPIKSIEIKYAKIDSLALTLFRNELDTSDITYATIKAKANQLKVPFDRPLESDGEIELNVTEISTLLNDKIGKISINEFAFNPKKKTILCKGFKLRQNLNTFQYAKKFGYDKLHAEIDIDSIVIPNVTDRALNFLDSINLNQVNIYKPIAHLFKDKRLPHPSTPVKFPFEAISEINLPIQIDSINVVDGQIWFKETVRNDGQTAKLDLTTINATLSNVTSQGPNKLSKWTELSGKIIFYHQLSFDFSWKFDLDKNGKSFIFDGKIGSAPLSVLNPFLLNAANGQFKKGYLNGGRLLAEGNKINGEGQLEFYYNHMKIELLKKESHQKDFGLNLVAGTANFLIRNNNNRGKNAKIGAVYAEPAQNKFILVYLWRLLSSGMQDIIIGSRNQKKSADRPNEYIKQKS